MSSTVTPRIIHQIWFDSPADQAAYMKEWQKLHPAWEYHLWSTTKARSFLETHNPEYLRIYDTLRFNIQRCDFFHSWFCMCSAVCILTPTRNLCEHSTRCLSMN